ncbi:MAG: dihydroorotate dehydrogenase-like protein [Bacteroidales bacterium]|nr:dihydroorotate dehydrogenase-like protein [Bacteroidales bacterium]
MIDITTNYLGLKLKNPFIAGSCGLTSKIEDIVKLEQVGAAAIVLRSIFEEEILFEAGQTLAEARKNRPIFDYMSEGLDNLEAFAKGGRQDKYLQLIADSKSRTGIPIIASINCVSDSEWISFTERIQTAGADAIELNISMNPMDNSNAEKEKTIISIIKKVQKVVKIPLAIKISDRYSNLSETILKLSKTGISGMVLFNRFFSPDIDIYNCKLVQGRMHSGETEYLKPLRWIALMSNKVDNVSLAASSGVHDANTAIKMILAGADAVQLVSSLYLNGKDYLTRMLSDLEEWMMEKGFFSVQQFKGKACYQQSYDPKIFERVQFMKYYGRIAME